MKATVHVEPHPFRRKGWRFWLCRRCYAPKNLHPRKGWVRARSLSDNKYFSAGAPHFEPGGEW